MTEVHIKAAQVEDKAKSEYAYNEITHSGLSLLLVALCGSYVH